MEYKYIIEDIEVLKETVRNNCIEETQYMLMDKSDTNSAHNHFDNKEFEDSVKYLWRHITKAMNKYFRDFKITFEESVVSIDKSTKNNSKSRPITPIDEVILSLIKFYDLICYQEANITIDNKNYKPNYTLFLPFINKYIFVMYVDINSKELKSINNTYAVKHDKYLENTIFIHNSGNSFIARYEFEMQLFNHLEQCLERNFVQIKKHV